MRRPFGVIERKGRSFSVHVHRNRVGPLETEGASARRGGRGRGGVIEECLRKDVVRVGRHKSETTK